MTELHDNATVTIGLTGPDWEPTAATKYYAQDETNPDKPGRFAFGPTPEAALAALDEEAKVTYWVMYSENVRMQGGKVETRTTQHYGTTDLATARKTVAEFRELASRGTHFTGTWCPDNCINSAWVEIETRTRVEG